MLWTGICYYGLWQYAVSWSVIGCHGVLCGGMWCYGVVCSVMEAYGIYVMLWGGMLCYRGLLSGNVVLWSVIGYHGGFGGGMW